MLLAIKKKIKKVFFPPKREMPVRWIQKDPQSWLAQNLADKLIKPSKNSFTDRIEKLAADTNNLGPQPLWEGYKKGDPTNNRGITRKANDVRTGGIMGDLYSELIIKKKPSLVVEFGTAFGVSGMFFLAGLETNQQGEMFTYDPNDVWAEIARKNLSQISNRFKLTIGTFEENIDKHLQPGQKIDLAFIDAIHTSEFVFPQLEIVVARCSPKAIIILDDINFSDDMQDCWKKVAADPRFSASAALGERVGIVELKN